MVGTFHIHTHGCQMNVHDSQRLADLLRRAGYVPRDKPEGTDVVVVNTCSIRHKAEHKLMSLLGTWATLKEEKPDAVLVVAGCVASQEGQNLLKRAPHVDLVVGPDNIVELPTLIHRIVGGEPPLVRTHFDHQHPQFLHGSPDQPPVSAFVTTMKGCDERCTYCVVPHTRGSERYRGAQDILTEIKALVRGGTKEVVLLGQTVNSWLGDDRDPAVGRLKPASRFGQLLRWIADEVPGLERLRYTSPHPRHVNGDLLSAHRDLDVLAQHVHLPVQSGSNAILRRMLRRYTREQYLDAAKALRRSRPGLTLSTDIIVGFPGETRADFEQTLELVALAGFTSLFGFTYSPRPHTPALKLADDVSEGEKSARLQELLALIGSQQNHHLQSLVGTHQRVIIEGQSRRGDRSLTGRTHQNEIVHVPHAPGLGSGATVQVRVDRAMGHSLAGSVLRILDPVPAEVESAPASAVPLTIPRRSLPLVSP